VRLALAAVFGAAALLWLAQLIAGMPPLIVTAAAASAAVYALLVAWLQRGAGRPAPLLLASVVWGASGAAFLSHALNDLARGWIAVLAGSDQARALTSTLAAPAIEEAAKAIGLVLIVLLWRRAIGGVRDGIVYGALIGIGFVFTENLLYLAFAVLEGGAAALARSVYLRGLLAGGNHAIFTATVGAGVGLVCGAHARGERAVAATLAVAAALVQHLAWNALASGAITRALCGAEVPGGACRAAPADTALFVVVPLLTLLFLGPGAGALFYLAVRTPAPQRS
jgi:RsiW-degrading membrane proteinase PrsW (M82 family)